MLLPIYRVWIAIKYHFRADNHTPAFFLQWYRVSILLALLESQYMCYELLSVIFGIALEYFIVTLLVLQLLHVLKEAIGTFM